MGLDARPDLLVVADWSRLRLYNTGPSTRGDIFVPVDNINLGFVAAGTSKDTTITIGNTGFTSSLSPNASAISKARSSAR